MLTNDKTHSFWLLPFIDTYLSLGESFPHSELTGLGVEFQLQHREQIVSMAFTEPLTGCHEFFFQSPVQRDVDTIDFLRPGMTRLETI